MPRPRRKVARAPSVDRAIKSVVDAKASASGRTWSLLHRAESILTLASGKRRRGPSRPRKKRKGGKTAKKQ